MTNYSVLTVPENSILYHAKLTKPKGSGHPEVMKV